jgi:hypothetical protein
MKILCRDRERIFLDGSEADWTALELHATTCAGCAEEVRSWKAISAAASQLRDYGDRPLLWTRIRRSLEAEESKRLPGKSLWDLLARWRSGSLVWQTALLGALVVVFALSGTFLLRQRQAGPVENGQLLKSRALADVERTERDYMQAIDKLAVDAKPRLDSPTPLIRSYREKIMVLDGAIDELRAETGQNPSNAHLRYQLLAMYQEKQETLEEILETKR